MKALGFTWGHNRFRLQAGLNFIAQGVGQRFCRSGTYNSYTSQNPMALECCIQIKRTTDLCAKLTMTMDSTARCAALELLRGAPNPWPTKFGLKRLRQTAAMSDDIRVLRPLRSLFRRCFRTRAFSRRRGCTLAMIWLRRRWWPMIFLWASQRNHP